jgi:hypothetical protein
MRTCSAHIGAYKIVVDEDLEISNENDIFVGPVSQQPLPKKRKAAQALMAEADKYISLRQSMHWGMKMLRATYARLTSVLTYNDTSRQLLLQSIFLMHNYRTNVLGSDQTNAVFGPEYGTISEFGIYDRVKCYFSLPE